MTAEDLFFDHDNCVSDCMKLPPCWRLLFSSAFHLLQSFSFLVKVGGLPFSIIVSNVSFLPAGYCFIRSILRARRFIRFVKEYLPHFTAKHSHNELKYRNTWLYFYPIQLVELKIHQASRPSFGQQHSAMPQLNHRSLIGTLASTDGLCPSGQT